MSRWAVVLAGGVGSRFWPISTPDRPKQLLPLIDDQPLLANTVRRLEPLVPASRTLVLTNASLVDAVAGLVPALPRANIIAEPKPAGTAAALAWAAAEIERRDDGHGDATMVCVHADWAIGDDAGFRAALDQAAAAAESHKALITVGIIPTRPDPGFGYIQPAEAVGGGVYKVARFVEKPDRATAERLRQRGYLWNSGIFVWRVADFLDELRAHCVEVAPALRAAGGDIAKFFAAVKPIAVDVGVMERSRRVLVLPGDFGWDDVGTWEALRRVRPLDAGGNAFHGPVHALASAGNVVHIEGAGHTVVLYGVQDLVIVSRPGLTMVTTIEKAADLKTLTESLPAPLRERP
jgi:mannose-1-phosphate guanylyltransferase